MKTTAEMIAVMQAFERGEEIQCIRLGIVDDWVKCATPPYKWNWIGYDYRIKPREPRVIWVNEYRHQQDVVHEDEESARKSAYGAVHIAVKYIEVIE